MLFNSLAFAVFLPIVLIGYHALHWRAQNLLLLAASLLFYGMWNWKFLGLLGFSILFDFFVGLGLEAVQEQKKRRLLLIASLCTSLGLLGFFKYYNFFLDSLSDLIAAFGLNPSSFHLDIVLPIGISFYTFHTISYVVDVYHRKLTASRDLVSFALFVTFFPQLVAGPIARASELLHQFEKPRRVSWEQIREGGALILVGFFKKVGVADALAPLADASFQNAELYGGWDLLFGLYLFSIQIYCDFSGYSDIARGVSKLFGVELIVNFKQPYFSASITEFWRRWHISLSTWLRDYLYISLGGNRGAQAKTYRNLMLTMLLGGLWHGASWTFVVWGGLHGLYLAAHKLLLEFRKKTPPRERSQLVARLLTLAKVVLTFHLVALTWIFFRADNFSQAWSYVTGIVTLRAGSVSAPVGLGEPWVIALLLMLLCLDYYHERAGDQTALIRLPWPVRGLCYAGLLLAIAVLGGVDAEIPFIYFQF